MPKVKRGDRVEMTGLMPDDPFPLPVGTRGTVVAVLNENTHLEQIVVDWDTKRSLFLLPQDPFRVI